MRAAAVRQPVLQSFAASRGERGCLSGCDARSGVEREEVREVSVGGLGFGVGVLPLEEVVS